MERKESAKDLRSRAEAMASARNGLLTGAAGPPSPEQLERVVHELRVHQIELELQNEELLRTQATLEASRDRYFDLYELAPVGYLDLNERGLILETNLRAAALLGFPRAEMARRSFFQFVFVDDERLYTSHHKRLFETGAPQAYDLRLANRTEVIWVHLEAVVAQSSTGEPECRMTLSDISARKRAENDLRNNNDLFSAFVRHSPIYVYIKEVTPSSSRVLHASDNFSQLVGIGGADITGKTMADLFPVEFAEKITAEDWNVASSGRTLMLAEELNGRYYTTFKFPLVAGDRTLLAGYTVDVTDQKLAESALRASEARYRTVTESAPDAIITIGGDGTIAAWNLSAQRMFGYEEAEVVGQPVSLIIPREFHDSHRDGLARVLAGGEAHVMGHTVEVSGLRKDGSQIPVDLSLSQWEIAEGNFFTAIIRDISARKRAEQEKAALEAQLQQSQKMESVGRLAGGVAHDFNNMLGVILGHAEIALDGVDPSNPLHTSLVEVRAAAKRSADLTRQLLAFARKQPVAPRVLDLNEVVAGMLTMLARLIGEDVRLGWLPAANLWPLRIDPTQIDQMLANLCVNARDAIAGVGTITIATANSVFNETDCAGFPGMAPGEFVTLTVSDDGCGIDSETINHIFEPFFTTKDAGKGTGLGLASVYGAVKQNGGFVSVASNVDAGTTFTICLPRTGESAASSAPVPARGPVAKGCETILLVEDELSILNLTRLVLERRGYDVIAASTPAEAIRLAEHYSGPIHLLMTDVVMPDMNGRVLAERLIASRPGLKWLFMSGYTADVIAHQGVLDAGLNFIQKPYAIENLAAAVRRALDGGERGGSE
ncbi:MAG: PAS domain S-box protein [Acidobacteriota bacterium]